jgi:molecular chaperone DnaJ
MNTPDPYQALGVAPTATDAEIKRAYRALAREHHPDRNPDSPIAETRFKTIQHAYDTLSDPAKRAAHDHSAGQVRGPAGPNANLDNIFGALFGGHKSGGWTTGARVAMPGRDIQTTTSLSFRQANDGGSVSLVLPLAVTCNDCGGTGTASGRYGELCPQCQGRGVSDDGPFSFGEPCSLCDGRGSLIERPCLACNRRGSITTNKRITANIPAGVRDGTKIKLAGQGEPGRNGGPPGDLYVVCRVETSKVFARKGPNLEVIVPLTLAEALTGATVTVPTLRGSKQLRVRAGTQPGTIQRLREEGPELPGKNRRGDIHYRFTVVLPDDAGLTAAERKLVKDLADGLTQADPRTGLLARAAEELVA